MSIPVNEKIMNKPVKTKITWIDLSIRASPSVANAISIKVSSINPPLKMVQIVGKKDKMSPINSENDINHLCLMESEKLICLTN